MCDWNEIESDLCNTNEPQDLVDLWDKTQQDVGDLEEQLRTLYPER